MNLKPLSVGGQIQKDNLVLVICLYQNTPTAINLSANIPLISIESAYNNNCAISEDFIPICWGANQFGQTGNYDEDDYPSRESITILAILFRIL